MNIFKVLLVLYLAFPPSPLAAGLTEDEVLPQSCHVEAIIPLVIYQPDDELLKDYAPYQKRISALTDYLSAHPACGLRLEGHTDSRKSSEYSFALAQRYADHVKKQLILQGADPDKIIAVSYGKEKPLVSELSKKAWAKNRRVEIKLH